jgi:energy-converting hydrogenase Eha subunit C
MLHDAIELLLYALLACFSPVAFTATVAVTPAGKLRVLGFGTAFVAAQLLTCSLFVILGVAANGSSRKSHSGIHVLLDLVLAAALIWLAARIKRKPPAPREHSSARTQAIVERLGRLRFGTTLLAGVLLGVGGPKRLVLTALAATTIVTSGVAAAVQAAFVVLYVAVATALVWVTVTIFVLLGTDGLARMKDVRKKLAGRQPQAAFYALLVLAALLVADAVGVLLL